jgi:hypothetical protein
VISQIIFNKKIKINIDFRANDDEQALITPVLMPKLPQFVSLAIKCVNLVL